MGLRSALLVCAFCLFAVHSLAGKAEKPAPIRDNSFLIEEGYNQESGVMQHIGALWYQRGGQFEFTFIQEFPLASKRNQLSYIVPVTRTDDDTGIGDVLLNYRYQLVDTDEVAFAPRLSLLLPTGDEGRGIGMGGAGVQVNLPLSAQITRHLVAHTNIGATYTPRADNGPAIATTRSATISAKASSGSRVRASTCCLRPSGSAKKRLPGQMHDSARILS